MLDPTVVIRISECDIVKFRLTNVVDVIVNIAKSTETWILIETRNDESELLNEFENRLENHTVISDLSRDDKDKLEECIQQDSRGTKSAYYDERQSRPAMFDKLDGNAKTIDSHVNNYVAYIIKKDKSYGKCKCQPQQWAVLDEHISRCELRPTFDQKSIAVPQVTFVIGGEWAVIEKTLKNNTPVIIVTGRKGLEDDVAKKLTRYRKDKDKRAVISDENVNQRKREHTTQSSKGSSIEVCSKKKDALVTAFLSAKLIDGKSIMYYALRENASKLLNSMREVFKADVRESDSDECESESEEQTTKTATPSKRKSCDSEYRMIYGNQLTLQHLHALYEDILRESDIRGSLLRRIIKKSYFYTHIEDEENDALQKSNLMPQVGRIIYELLGNKYRLLYQERAFRELDKLGPTGEPEGEHLVPYISKKAKWPLCTKSEVESVWHIFLWAVISHERDMAEHFLFETDCIIGGALIAAKMLGSMADVAKTWKETAYLEELEENKTYFENLAKETIDSLYDDKKEAAYKNLLAVIPFRLGPQNTPMSIANDAECMNFIGHASCQTLLSLIWHQYMDLDTPFWKYATVLPFSLPWIRFDKTSLFFGKNEGTENSLKWVSNTVEAFFRLQNFYTAPVVKMSNSVVSYLFFLSIFSLLVLSKLKPVDTIQDISWSEWLVYTWFAGLLLQELRQILLERNSGPLYNVHWTLDWHETWFWWERIKFVLRLHRVVVHLSDVWNQYDFAMILLFLTSVVLRFSVSDVDFQWVRFFFCITLIVYYLRLLRYGYVTKHFGPRILMIGALITDMIKFFLILSLVLISFGIAFQSLVSGNEDASWRQLADILWRPYWQMFGELFIDDPGMGREVHTRACYNNRTRAKIEDGEMCNDWMPILLLAVFMLITNIMLLNLLIAILSNSFEKIESESETIWRFHLYGLGKEYYEAFFLPSPFNIPYVIFCFLRWLTERIGRCCFNVAVHTEQNKVKEEYDKNQESNLERHALYRFYYTDIKKERSYNNHFRQGEELRNTKRERKAYNQMKKVNQEVEKQSPNNQDRLIETINEMKDMMDTMKTMKSPDLQLDATRRRRRSIDNLSTQSTYRCTYHDGVIKGRRSVDNLSTQSNGRCSCVSCDVCCCTICCRT